MWDSTRTLKKSSEIYIYIYIYSNNEQQSAARLECDIRPTGGFPVGKGVRRGFTLSHIFSLHTESIIREVEDDVRDSMG